MKIFLLEKMKLDRVKHKKRIFIYYLFKVDLYLTL